MPSLDGLRAISIVLVLLGHLNGSHGFGKLDLQIGDYAYLGVVVFFVISGFLITNLLISEYAEHGRVSLKLFYARRGLRIFPASYAYIAVVVLLWCLGAFHLRQADLVCAVLYLMNYLPHRTWQLAHLWSLSVEEQFYLLWPFTFAMVRPARRSWVLAGVIFVAVLSRLGSRLFLAGTPYRDLEMFPMVGDSLATGCLLATMRGWLEQQSWYVMLLRPSFSVVILLMVLFLNRYMGYSIVSIFGTVLVNTGIAVLIHRSVYFAGDRFGRILNWKPVAFIGMLSYSLYLWQQLFINRNADAWINQFPMSLVLTLAAALVSYFGLEKPLMALRSRLRARSAATAAAAEKTA
ncbi:MAG TPA: acyltransferase [Terracidiphilus sp.]